MHVLDILSADRIAIAGEAAPVRDKAAALGVLAELLARSSSILTRADVLDVLTRREELQSTGVGGGVAIPHGSLDNLEGIAGALLVCPSPIDFSAIDGEPVSILFAIVGPKRSTGEHLKTLARVSRLLRDDAFRKRLVETRTPGDIIDLIRGAEAGRA